jgi:hypothetical protein
MTNDGSMSGAGLRQSTRPQKAPIGKAIFDIVRYLDEWLVVALSTSPIAG